MAELSTSARIATIETVFLDRDGVVNTKMPEGQWVTSPAEFKMLPGVVEAIAALKREGLRVIVVTNQRGIALGRFTLDGVQAIHEAFQRSLRARGAEVDSIYLCPHDRGQCNCRKPLPGLFEQAVRDCPAIQPATSLMIGDSASDIEFGRRLGMMTMLIEGDPRHRKPGGERMRGLADAQAASLRDGVDWLLSVRREPLAGDPDLHGR